MQTLKLTLATVGIFAVSVGLAYGIGGNSRQLWNCLPLLWLLFAISFAIQIVAFIFAAIFKIESFYDLTGSLTYLTLALLGLFLVNAPNYHQYIAALMIIIWTLRLGAYLFSRIISSGGDSRFDQIKKSHFKFFVTWLVQGLWVVITAAPLFVVICQQASKQDIHALEAIGVVLWAFGLVFETISDYQKSVFRENKQNKGKFIKQGLWSISRHPNYFGQIVLWIGAALYAIPSLSGWEFLSMISPIFVCILIMGISGVPILEKKADEKWGRDEQYIQYKRQTPVLVPFTCGDHKVQNVDQISS